MKKYKDHQYADCLEPENHHKKEHRLIEEARLQHTPTPWKINQDNKATIVSVNGNTRGQGAIVADAFNEADAEFIVRAVNSHEALLETAKMLASTLLMRKMNGEEVSKNYYEKLMELIQQAEGK